MKTSLYLLAVTVSAHALAEVVAKISSTEKEALPFKEARAGRFHARGQHRNYTLRMDVTSVVRRRREGETGSWSREEGCGETQEMLKSCPGYSGSSELRSQASPVHMEGADKEAHRTRGASKGPLLLCVLLDDRTAGAAAWTQPCPPRMYRESHLLFLLKDSGSFRRTLLLF